MEGVGTAMGMPIPLLPLFSLLLLPPLLPLREERDVEEKEDIVLLRATCSDCTAGNCRYKDPAARVLLSQTVKSIGLESITQVFYFCPHFHFFFHSDCVRPLAR